MIKRAYLGCMLSCLKHVVKNVVKNVVKHVVKHVVKKAAITFIAITACAVQADGGILFKDLVSNGASGIEYSRQPSAADEIWKEMKSTGFLAAADVPFVPTKPRGMPGVAVFDYDGDGDQDIYVTNGPGRANSLYVNQLQKTGRVTFVDMALNAGVHVTDQDSTGVCFGDIDNDGDRDLYVLGNSEANRLFENLGNGKFKDITAESGLGAGNNASSSCSFGDVNGDGLLDVAVANLFDNLDFRLPIMSLDHDHLVQDDQLFVNTGDNIFVDKSEESGIKIRPATTWAIAFVDYDLDGDVDLFKGEDQAGRTPAENGGRDAGVLQLLENDGNGRFTNVTDSVDGGRFGAWMSMAFGDLNSDGYMDFFGSNAGAYFAQAVVPLIEYIPDFRDWSSVWFLGNKSLSFDAPNVGELVATPFGWGGETTDYDNDGDLDIIYHGGWENGAFVDASNPGAVLKNDGKGNFSRDAMALSQSVDHARRTVHGVAVGDLNNDGFPDIVSASNMDWPAQAPLIPYFDNVGEIFGGPFDEAANFIPTFSPVDPADLFKGFNYNGIELANGSLAVEINSADNGNKSVVIELLGSHGITTNGRVNRDALGAVITFKPKRGDFVMKPVLSGGTHASSHSLAMTFGMANARRGIVEVLWPGGVRNRLYNVKAGEHLIIPEIPCSFDDKSLSRYEYNDCVQDALYELYSADVIDFKMFVKLYVSAVRAFGKNSLTPTPQKVAFEDLSENLDFLHNTQGGEGHGGIAWLDYDNDGLLDVYMTNGFGEKNGLFRNNGDNTFTDVTDTAGVGNGLGNSGVLAGDIDNDGYTDLFLTSAGNLFTPVVPTPVKLYHNNGDGTFTDITATSGITDIMTSWGAAFGDANGDGYLDLVVTTPNSVVQQREDKNRFFLNNGDLSFTDVSDETGFANSLGGCLAVFTDYDLDGDQDLLFASCNEIDISVVPVNLYRNDGNMKFTDVTLEAGLGDRLGAWMGFAIGDYDNDGDQDFFSTNLGNFPGLSVLPVFYENNGDGTFSDVTETAGVDDNLFGWGATMSDFDNDGYVDLFYTGSFPFQPFNMTGPLVSPGTLYMNKGNKTFINRDHWFGIDLSHEFTTGVAAADFNNDGYADLSVVRGGTNADGTLGTPRDPGHPLLLANGGGDNNFITVKTRGTYSNRDGIGARVVVQSGGLIQTKEVRAGSSFLSTESPWLTFGIGKNTRVDSVKIYWPSGYIDKYRHIRAGKTLTVIEGKRNREDADD